MAGSNIEKFLIEFGFKGDKALNKLKEVVREYDKLNRQVVQNTIATKKQAGAEKQRAIWLSQVHQQKKKTSSVDRFIAAREQEDIKKNQALRTETQKQQLAMQKRLEASTKRVNAVYNRRKAIENRVARLSGALGRSQAFTAIAAADPSRASALRSKFETGIRRGDEKAIQRVRDAMAQYGRQVASTRNKVLSLKTVQNGLKDSTRNMLRSYVSLFSIFGATKSINKVGQGFEAMESAMLAAMGNKEDAARNIQFLDEMTSRLGLSLLDTADQYTKFVFASKGKLDTEQVNTFFESVAEAGTVLGVSRERMKLSFNALQQMLNKTTVQNDELKRQ